MTKTIFGLVAALLVAVPANHANLERPASESDLLRAFAFARCIEKAYQKTPFGEDAQRVANAYFELGKINKAEAYDRIAKVAESLDASKPTVRGGHSFAIMACLEFYESAKLKQLTQKSAGRPAAGKE
jgi:hypothetical protein